MPQTVFLLSTTISSSSSSSSSSSIINISNIIVVTITTFVITILVTPLSFPSLPGTLTTGELVMEENDCPMCDLTGSKAGLIGPQFCAAPENFSTQLPPQGMSLCLSRQRMPQALGQTHGRQKRHTHLKRYNLQKTDTHLEIHGLQERDMHLKREMHLKKYSPPERDKHLKTQGVQKQSPSPPPHKITSRGGSNSPEPAHPVRGSISSPAAAPTPDVVARPTVDEEIHATGLDQNPPVSPNIQSEDLSHPSGQGQEKKPDQKPTPLYADVVRRNMKETNQSSKKQYRPSAKSKKPSEDEERDWPLSGNFANSTWKA
ncbi:hypothetical protein FDENT_1562 [Fusarium denticulatum]|uniref:Uncharacterized protein n=1 Tax=Fusarium denticulatum TaxID=48507 RepID=A0A8H6CW32_9HYPO|nr:hypothetical protein FDENT_1562 [Fusarium denticulatum]